MALLLSTCFYRCAIIALYARNDLKLGTFKDPLRFSTKDCKQTIIRQPLLFDQPSSYYSYNVSVARESMFKRNPKTRTNV